MMTLTIKPSGQACGAEVRGIDLGKPLSSEQVSDIKKAWSEYHVLSFPDQKMTDDDLEAFTCYFG
ncbi:MAG: TauD/TfdA family dioxygenase, partial [Robiginitomaculum sp.]|nr:TauD/TfdA family dioxygenase [Robiginitomaculum sp.]